MVAITTFSTEKFYAAVTGSRLDPSVGTARHELSIPSDGTHFIGDRIGGESAEITDCP